jgi:hypothetical protein
MGLFITRGIDALKAEAFWPTNFRPMHRRLVAEGHGLGASRAIVKDKKGRASLILGSNTTRRLCHNGDIFAKRQLVKWRTSPGLVGKERPRALDDHSAGRRPRVS